VVTIRGQLGSGAPEIGRQVADILHADYVDREIIAEVAARLHRQEREVIAKEMPPSSLLSWIAEALGHSHAFHDGFTDAYLPSRKYFSKMLAIFKHWSLLLGGWLEASRL